jgi:hypothetical protein
MQRKDKIKAIIAVSLLVVIALTYWSWGKEVSKYVALAAILIWLPSIFILNKKG